jgi:hypothetical protein
MHALGHLLHTWVHGGASGENSIGVQVFPEVIGARLSTIRVKKKEFKDITIVEDQPMCVSYT